MNLSDLVNLYFPLKLSESQEISRFSDNFKRNGRQSLNELIPLKAYNSGLKICQYLRLHMKVTC